ncbi:AI-2E family transporter [Desulfosarcina sp. OttesenSCG-928-A07]|nr:AI-2E family transporter [Desulfosarcina sp. OttesenSCG-928-A07]
MLNLLRNWKERHFSDPQRIILGLMLLAGIGIVYFLGSLLTPVFVSIIIAYLLDGLVIPLHQRIGLPRIAAVLVVFMLFIAGMTIMILWLLPLITKQVTQLVQQLPRMLVTLQSSIMQLPAPYPELISKKQIVDIIGFLNVSIADMGKQVLSLSLASVVGLIHLLVYLVLVPFMVFFLLKDKTAILSWGQRFLPDNMDLTASVWQEANAQVSNYIRGKCWEVLIVWAVSDVVFRVLDFQFSMVVSLFVGLSVLIPYLGVTVMGMVVSLIAFVQWGISGNFIAILAAYTIIQILDGTLLAPLLLSGVVHLHPVAIVVAVLLFGGLWGVWGLFFAIPLATLINAVLKVGFTRNDPLADLPVSDPG